MSKKHLDPWFDRPKMKLPKSSMLRLVNKDNVSYNIGMKKVALFFLILVSGFLAFSDELKLGASPQIVWKVVIVAAANNDGLENWDHAREEVHSLFLKNGVKRENIVGLSAHSKYIGTEFGGSKIKKALGYNIKFALEDLHIVPGDGVIVYVSSHGAKNGGISLSASNGYLGIGQFKDILEAIPPQTPTVLLISTCYSGQFINGMASSGDAADSGNLQSPYRIILTAARNDRTSFGCGSGNTMPEWDDSFTDIYASMTKLTSFYELAQKVKESISEKESGWDEKDFSYPQAFFGEKVRGLNLPFAPH